MTGEIIMPAHQEIRLPDFAEKRKLSSAEMGTAMHTFMEEADFRKKYTREEIDSLTAELVQRGLTDGGRRKISSEKGASAIFESEMAERLRGAERIGEGTAVFCADAAEGIILRGGISRVKDEILVNGILTATFTEKDVGILIDYKSDRIYDEGRSEGAIPHPAGVVPDGAGENNGDFHSGDLSLFLCDGEGNSFDIRGKGSILN